MNAKFRLKYICVLSLIIYTTVDDPLQNIKWKEKINRKHPNFWIKYVHAFIESNLRVANRIFNDVSALNFLCIKLTLGKFVRNATKHLLLKTEKHSMIPYYKNISAYPNKITYLVSEFHYQHMKFEYRGKQNMVLLFNYISSGRQRMFIQKFKSLNTYMQRCIDFLELHHVEGSSVKFCHVHSNFNFYPPHAHVECTLHHTPTSALIISIIFDIIASGIIVSTQVSEEFVKNLQIKMYQVELI